MNRIHIYFGCFLITINLLLSGSQNIVSDECIQCICTGGCEITMDYWIDGEEQIIYGDETANPYTAYENCRKDLDCSTRTIRSYMSRYQRDCNNDGYIDCYDYVAIHRLGPNECRSQNRVQGFLARIDGCLKKELQSSVIVTNDCIQCICMDDGCGISYSYWIDSGEPRINEDELADTNVAYMNCLRNFECTTISIQNYMNTYQMDCNNDGKIDCTDHSSIHRFGPYHCGREPSPKLYKSHLYYINTCLNNRSGTVSITSSFGTFWLMVVSLYLQIVYVLIFII